MRIISKMALVMCSSLIMAAAISGTKPDPKAMEQKCKNQAQADSQKIVNDMEQKAKAAKNAGFSKEKALAQAKKDIYEGCMKAK